MCLPEVSVPIGPNNTRWQPTCVDAWAHFGINITALAQGSAFSQPEFQNMTRRQVWRTLCHSSGNSSSNYSSGGSSGGSQPSYDPSVTNSSFCINGTMTINATDGSNSTIVVNCTVPVIPSG